VVLVVIRERNRNLPHFCGGDFLVESASVEGLRSNYWTAVYRMEFIALS